MRKLTFRNFVVFFVGILGTFWAAELHAQSVVTQSETVHFDFNQPHDEPVMTEFYKFDPKLGKLNSVRLRIEGGTSGNVAALNFTAQPQIDCVGAHLATSATLALPLGKAMLTEAASALSGSARLEPGEFRVLSMSGVLNNLAEVEDPNHLQSFIQGSPGEMLQGFATASGSTSTPVRERHLCAAILGAASADVTYTLNYEYTPGASALDDKD